MGLTIRVNDFDCFDIGYFSFTNFRFTLAETYNTELGELYKKWIWEGLTQEEFDKMNKIAGNLMIFLVHSDCEGIFMPSESRKIYKCIENLKMSYKINPNYHLQGELDVFERLKSMFYYSWKNRRRIIFS